VLTGLSGAGKQLACLCFEDMGWRVVENVPPALIAALLQEIPAEPLCLLSDIRSGQVASLLPALDALSCPPIIVFVDASEEALVRRFKETRRPHPLFKAAGGILPAITAERDALASLKARADVVVDTSSLSPAELRGLLAEHFGEKGQPSSPLTVTVASFGFKHGTPLDADILFDVRFLNNPYYVEALRGKNGRDPEVDTFVMADERTGAFLEKLYDLVGFTLPHYVAEGKAYLTIGIGCTGGKHRSVALAERLGQFVSERGYRVLVQHRDVERH
jgi:RNase adapter protein RapZ